MLQFLIGCPFRDIGKSGSGSVVPEIRIRVRDLERHIQIVPDTDDDDPVTGLRDSVVFRFVEMNDKIVSGFPEILKNLPKVPGSGRADSGDVFCQKPVRRVFSQDFDPVPV